MKRKAFSLVELISACAIAAVLAALLLPAFVKARNRAGRSRCSTEMRQVALALSMYLEDRGAPVRRLGGWPEMDAWLDPYTGRHAAALMSHDGDRLRGKWYYIHPHPTQGVPTRIGAYDGRHKGTPLFGWDVPMRGGSMAPWSGKPAGL